MKNAIALATTKKVKVTLPVVKLRIDDLSYLQGVTNREGKTKCSIPVGNYHRLLLLGLIEKVEIPVDPKLIKKFEAKRAAALASIREIVNRNPPDYPAIRGLNTYTIGDGSKPVPQWEVRITAAGRALIKDGNARVEVKASCK